MKTRQQLVDDLNKSFEDVQQFVNLVGGSTGMHLEARVKLLEHRVEDLYWMIGQLLAHVPEQTPERKNET